MNRYTTTNITTPITNAINNIFTTTYNTTAANTIIITITIITIIIEVIVVGIIIAIRDLCLRRPRCSDISILAERFSTSRYRAMMRAGGVSSTFYLFFILHLEFLKINFAIIGVIRKLDSIIILALMDRVIR